MKRELGDGYELDDDRARIDLDAVRGRGLGEQLVRETVDRGPYADYRWLLDTTDGHGLYEKFGFGRPSERLMERQWRPGGDVSRESRRS
jgi:GNAT superfamily N-acetyltransferase